MRFNRQFRVDFKGPIYRRDDFDSDFRSKFEFRFEFGPKIVEFERKLVEFVPKRPKIGKLGRFWFKFNKFSIKFDHFRLNNRQ